MERNEIIAKLTALHNSLKSWLKNTQIRHYDAQSTQDLFKRWELWGQFFHYNI